MLYIVIVHMGLYKHWALLSDRICGGETHAYIQYYEKWNST